MLNKKELELIKKLIKKLNYYRATNQVRKNYYHGENKVLDLQISTPPQLRAVHQSLGWIKIATDAPVDRLDLQGWSLSEAEADEYGLNELYDENYLQEEARNAHLDALRYGVSFVIIGQGTPGTAEPEVLITAESPFNVTANYNLRTRRVKEAIQITDENEETKVTYGTLFTEQEIISFAILPKEEIVEVGERIQHNMNRCPVVQLTNSRDSGSSKGHSHITTHMMTITNSALRTMLGIESAREFFTMPPRYILNAANEFRDADGNAVDPFTAIMSKVLAIPAQEAQPGEVAPPKPEIGQLPGGSPDAYIAIMEFYAQAFASVATLPHSYLMKEAAQPTSADAIRAQEARLIKLAANKVASFSRSWSEVAQLALLIRDGELPEGATGIKPMWADVSTISPGAAADRVQKLVASGILQPTSEIVLRELGFSRADRELIRQENNQALSSSYLNAIIEANRATGATEAVEEVEATPTEQAQAALGQVGEDYEG